MRKLRFISLGVFSLALVATVLSLQAAAEAVQWSMTVDANTTGLWLFTEGTGTSAACSVTGMPAGVLTNTAPWVPGRINSAVACYPGYVGMTDNAGERPATAITVEGWFKMERPTGYPVCKNGVYLMWLGQTVCASFYVDGAWREVDGNIPTPTGRWTHLAMTWQRNSSSTGTATLYVDGVLDVSQQFSGLSTGLLAQGTLGIRLGQDDWDKAGGSESDCKVDAFRISNKARSFDPLTPQTTMAVDATTAGLWKFTEGTGTSSACAVTGMPAGTLNGTATWTAGVSDNAINFNTGYVGIADNAALRPATAITVEAYAKLNTASGDLVYKSNCYRLGMSSGVITAYFYIDGAWRSITGALPVPTGHWTHLAITYQQNSATTGTAAIWVDGNLDMKQMIYGLTTGLINQSTVAMRLGQNDSGGNQVSGSIDNFRISNNARVFSPSVPYGPTAGNLCPNGDFEAGLVSFRMFGDGDTSLIWSTTTTNVKCGLRCAQSTMNNNTSSLLSRPIPVNPGQTYMFSAWYRADANTRYPGVKLMNAYDTSGSPLWSNFPSVGTSWVQVSQSYTVPAGITSVCLSFQGDSPGQIFIDDVRFQAASSIQSKTLPDMIAVGPATVPLGNFYTYTSGSTTATTLNIVNSDTASHTFTVSAVVTDAEGVAGAPVTVGNYTLSAGTGTTATYQLRSDLRGCYLLGFNIADSGGTSWTQLAQYKYAVGPDLTGVGDATASIFAMNAHLDTEPGSHATNNMTMLAKCGVKHVRIWWGWGMCENPQGTFTWTEYDRQYNAVNGAGLKVMANVQRGQSSMEYSWTGPVTSGGYSLYMYTSVLPEWETYVGKIAQRYAGNIASYELWNEPTMAHPTSVTSAQYVTLLKDTRPYMVAQDANAKIVAFAGVDTNYMSQVLSNNTAQYMDYVSDHPYGNLYRPEVLKPARITSVRGVMTAKGCPTNMPIWDSEQGIYADGDGYRIPSFTEADVAQLYTRNVVTAKSVGIGKFFWFAAHSSQLYGFGVYYADHIPRPRLMALNACASFTEGMTWQTSYTFNAATYAHMFSNATYGLAVVWCKFGPQTITLSMSPGLLSAYDMNGNAITITGSSTSTINLPSQRPIYIRCSAANYSSLNSAVSGMTMVNTGAGISYTLGTTTTVTVTNQSRNQIDGIVSLIVASPPPPGDWPAAQKFDSLLPGRSRTFTFTVVEGASAIGQIQVQIGDVDLETIAVVTSTDSTPPSAPPAVRDGMGADVSTTSSTTQLSANWDASTDNESGISGYQYAIGTSAGGTQTVNWTSLGNVTTVTKTGLTLTVGQTYYFSVKAVNGIGLTGSATNSDGQTVVAVSPATYFSDNFESWAVHGGAWSSVNGENGNHTLDTSTDHAAAGSKCLKITDTDSTGTTGAYLRENFSPVISGDIYVRFYIFLPTGYGSANSTCSRRILRVYMDAGNYTVITLTGDGMAVAEVGGWSGTGTTTISENAWHCVELHVAPPSASTAIEFWVDGTSGGTLTGAYSGNSTFNYLQFGDMALASGSPNGDGTTYWDEVIVSNFYNGLLDTTPPSPPPAVRDGTGADISTTSSTTQLSANWDASTDNESGISGYQYAIGTSAGGTQTVNWTSLGNVTTVTKSGLALTAGQTYYFSVQAVNGVGLTGSATNSNGQTVVDSTPPTAPANVRDGAGADISTTNSTTQLLANWDAATDVESGISGYQYAIGTSAGGTQTVNWTSLGNVTTVTKTGLTLALGQTYYFSVQAVNGAGLTGSATNSNGQTVVDTTPPSTPPTVRDGAGADISTTSSTTQLLANWDASTDAESGISGYQYAIGTSAGGTQTVNWTSLGNVTTVTKSGLTLAVGQTYYFSVQAVNGAGLTGSATNSNGQTVVDTTPPSTPPTVRDGVGADISTTSSTTQLLANWDASTDAESGISGYQYAIGTSAGGTQTVNWTSLGNVTTVTKTGLTLAVGQTYYFSVKAVNGSGLIGSATNSNGQTVVDTTPPSTPPTVRDGTGADISTTNSATQLSANWDASTDAESGISGYQYAIGISAGGTQTVNWTSLGNVTTVTKSGLTLTVGQTYYFSVQAVNGVGLTGSATNSNGQTVVDTTPPSAPVNVRDGTGADISTTNSCSQLSANWDASTDVESGISGYQYAIGTSAGGTQTVNWTSLGNVTTVTKSGLTLAVGQTYYFSVQAVNGAGLTGSATNSNGQTVVDTTPPSATPTVRDGVGADISTTGSTTQLLANWDASTDAESGISGYQYAIGTSAGGTQTVNWTSLGNVTTVTKSGLTLAVGQTYYFSVQAVNGAGLTGSATNSNGQTVVDTTPPNAPASVRDGVGADISTTSSTTQLSANWDASTDAESGISGYQYAIGTSAGGTQTVNWTLLGNVTTVTKTGLTLSVGQTYFFSVQAVNGAGLTSSATNSNGQTVVSVSNVVYFSDNFENWTVHGGAWSSVNGESATHTLNTSIDYAMAGIKSLKITDSDTTATTGASLTKNFSPVISGDIYVRFFMFLPTGYGSANPSCSRRIVRVYMDAGNYTVITLSGTSLSVAEVGGWTGTGSTALSENAWHCVELRVAQPSASTAIQYWVDGTSGGTCTGAYSGNSTFTYMQFGDVALASGSPNGTGTIYWDEVIVANYYIDPSAPSAPANVRDGTGADISTTTSTTQLSANWDAATDADSGISGYQYAIGTTAGGTQTVNWTSLGNVTTVTQAGLTLIEGQTYYFSVRAVNGAGLNSAGTNSNGQTVVDTTAPSAPPAVRDGTGADIATTSSTAQLSANWDASTDNESGISGYQYAIGTTAGGTQTVNWTSLSNVTTVTRTGLTLTIGQTYYFSVKAVNGAGLTGSATNSDGQTVVTVYFQDNFESWAVHGGAWSSTSGENVNHTLDTSTTFARAGTKSLKLTDNDTTATSGACLVRNFSPTIAGNLYVRFYVYLPSAYVSSNNGAASRRLLRVFCGTNRGQMSIYSGNKPLMEEVGAWGSSLSASTLSADAWHCIEMYMATPSASTAMQYWVDGTSTGTLNGSFSGSTSYDRIEFGDVSVGGGTNVTGTFYLDEFVACDTYIGLLP